MKKVICTIYFSVFVPNALTIIMDRSLIKNEEHKPAPVLQFQEPSSFNEALRSCFAERNYGTFECFNRGALTALQSWNDNDCLDFGNVKLDRSDGESRDILNFDWDTTNFGSVVKAASKILESRNMKWDLGNIYPGLQMRVGPTLSAENGILEFVMDERGSRYISNRQLSTDHNIINHGYSQGINSYHSNGIDLTGNLGTILHDQTHQYQPYRAIPENSGFPIEQHVLRDIVNVYESSENKKNDDPGRKVKNFVWSRNES